MTGDALHPWLTAGACCPQMSQAVMQLSAMIAVLLQITRSLQMRVARPTTLVQTAPEVPLARHCCFVWLLEPEPKKAGSRCSSKACGAQFAARDGIGLLLM